MFIVAKITKNDINSNNHNNIDRFDSFRCTFWISTICFLFASYVPPQHLCACMFGADACVSMCAVYSRYTSIVKCWAGAWASKRISMQADMCVCVFVCMGASTGQHQNKNWFVSTRSLARSPNLWLCLYRHIAFVPMPLHCYWSF